MTTLQITWFFLWALLWAIFFMTDGYDFGIGTIFPFMARSEEDKKVMVGAMGPFWDANEVWLVAAGGVTFAAFPTLYATMFSSFYTALMLILFALIFRGVALEFWGKTKDPVMRGFWELCIFAGSVTPAILFGVAFANIFKGIPLDQNGVFHGNLFTLLNGYGLLGGLLFLLLFIEHGAIWLAIKSDGDLQRRASLLAGGLWWLLLAVTIGFLTATRFETRLFQNYYSYPILFGMVLVVLAAFAQTKFFLFKEAYFKAWFSSALSIVGCIFFAMIGLFPNVMPSSIHPSYNLTAFNSSSSPLTLMIMLGVVLVFVPIILAYQTWGYYIFRDKLTEDEMGVYDETY